MSGRARPPTIPGYTILGLLGEGAMGAVYRAKQESMDRVVALKVISEGLAADAEYVGRFLREARSIGRLNHPNIVQGYDSGQADGNYFLVMEYVEGESLDKTLRRGPLPEEGVRAVARQVASALHHAHEHGLIHRDIKPSNIIATPDGVHKVTDFGLARATEDPALTIAGQTMGTPYFLPPQLVNGQGPIDIRCDVYSLGATLYMLASGRPPFTGGTASEVIGNLLQAEARPLREVAPGISEAFSNLVAELMRKDVTARPQTPAAVLAALDALAAPFDPNSTLVDPARQAALERARAAAAAVAAAAATATATAPQAPEHLVFQGKAPLKLVPLDPVEPREERRPAPRPAPRPEPRADPAPRAQLRAVGGFRGTLGLDAPRPTGPSLVRRLLLVLPSALVAMAGTFIGIELLRLIIPAWNSAAASEPLYLMALGPALLVPLLGPPSVRHPGRWCAASAVGLTLVLEALPRALAPGAATTGQVLLALSAGFAGALAGALGEGAWPRVPGATTESQVVAFLGRTLVSVPAFVVLLGGALERLQEPMFVQAASPAVVLEVLALLAVMTMVPTRELATWGVDGPSPRAGEGPAATPEGMRPPRSVQERSTLLRPLVGCWATVLATLLAELLNPGEAVRNLRLVWLTFGILPNLCSSWLAHHVTLRPGRVLLLTLVPAGLGLQVARWSLDVPDLRLGPAGQSAVLGVVFALLAVSACGAAEALLGRSSRRRAAAWAAALARVVVGTLFLLPLVAAALALLARPALPVTPSLVGGLALVGLLGVAPTLEWAKALLRRERATGRLLGFSATWIIRPPAD